MEGGSLKRGVFWRPRRGGVIDGGSGVGGPAHNWKGGLSETRGTVLSLRFWTEVTMMGEGVMTGNGAGQQVSFEGLNGFDEVRHLQDLRWAGVMRREVKVRHQRICDGNGNEKLANAG